MIIPQVRVRIGCIYKVRVYVDVVASGTGPCTLYIAIGNRDYGIVVVPYLVRAIPKDAVSYS